MGQRGRPPEPGVLTEREFEVLRLIQSGLSNRQISERLGISLSGTKFHITEIRSKLGLASRDELMSWEVAPQREHKVLSVLPLFGWFRDGLSLFSPRPILAATAVAIALGGVSIAGYATWSAPDSGRSTAASEAASPEVCSLAELNGSAQGDVSFVACSSWAMPPQRLTSSAELPETFSLQTRLPDNIGNGYHAIQMTYSEGELMHSEASRDVSGPSWRQERPAYIWAEYAGLGEERFFLTVDRGFLPYDSGEISESDSGTLEIGPHQLFWRVDAGGFMTLAWNDEIRRTSQESWELNIKTGEMRVESEGILSVPRRYTLSSSVLSLPELTRIAETVLED